MTLALQLAFDFWPHGQCYLWEPGLVWSHVVSDVLIGAAYVAIFSTLVYLIRRIRDIPFEWMYLAFAVFIVTCGLTHLMAVWNVWHPDYWAAAWVKVATAVASVGTALLLPPLVPKAIALAEAARTSHERGVALERAHRELGEMLDKTRELERLKTQFFANVSHELRTPLALILGPVDSWLGRPEVPADLRRDLELMGRSARTVLKHVNDLLDVSRLEEGKVEPSYAQLDLAQLARFVAGHFEGHARERGIELAVDAPEQLEAEVDGDRLERVLLNLLSNAFKFTPDGGCVRVVVALQADHVRLEVRDSGPGIPADQRAAVFERFTQLSGGDTRRFGGTGLGLAIARDFVALQRGEVTVDDAPEGGARLTVTLPRRAPAGVDVRRDQSAAARAAADLVTRQAVEELRERVEAAGAPVQTGARPASILVVDDNPDMRRFVAEALARDYQVEVAVDGADGLRRATERPPDLILTDVMMPNMSGDALVAAARARPELDPVPIVLLTAKADDELRVRLLKAGAQDYLMKPFSVEELRARLANLVTMKRAREVLQREVEQQVRDLESLAEQVTSRKRDLARALDAAQVAREYAEQASRAKSNFLNLVSHELRTPLSTLLLQLEVLQRVRAGEANLGERHAQTVGRMRRSAQRLLELVESLLHVARLETGKIEVRPEEVDLRALVGDVVDELRPQAEQKGLGLAAEGTADLPHVTTDPRLLRTVLVNLVGNAVKFTDRGGVTLRGALDGGEVVLEVADTGPGIPPEKQQAIFEPFHHLEAVEHKSTPGMGLGLSIARELARALGGRIDLASAPGAGSTFAVRLPVRSSSPPT